MVTISLPNDQRGRLRKCLRGAGRREIGGVLMGEQVAPDHFRIVDFSVDGTTGTAAHFVRSPEHHTEALDAFFRKTGSDFKRFNYLGEWHSHPSFSVRPSHDDLTSMQGLVEGEQDIDFSALVIVRLRCLFLLEAAAYMFIRDRAYARIGLTT
jgi:[CysO sulfur-carrier protein]-S-L-cysteine hydrolase